ncbi:MAG: DUF4129 domain-containing protein [Candidatus Hydrogenedentota bacterium]
MRLDRQTGIERGGIALTEEALQLVRTAPPACLLAYYLGSIPFVMILLYFWAEMSYSADAYYYRAPGALAVALAFVWMKAWQSVYARRLLAHVREEPPPEWTFRRIVHLTATQAIVHATGFFLLIPALIFVIPFLYVYGVLQNVTILGDGKHGRLSSLFRHSWQQATQWPRQSLFIIWLLSPVLVVVGLLVYLVLMPVLTMTVPEAWTVLYSILFRLALLILCPLGFAVTLNLQMMMVVIPQLGRIFLGLQSMSLQTGLMYDSTLMSAVVGGMTYLLMDPLVKAAFVLRCFYNESRATGVDLRVALRRIVRTASVALFIVALLLCTAGPAHAQENPAPEDGPEPSTVVDQQELDRAINDTLEQDIYRWRQPRVTPEKTAEEEPLGPFLQAIQDFFKWLIEAFREIFESILKFIKWLIPDRSPDMSGAFGWLGGARFLLTALLVVLLVALVGFLGMMAFRSWRSKTGDETEAEAVEVDLEDENVSPDELPESGWRAMARDLLDKNEPRLALRALFLAGLAFLGRRNFIRIAKGKSNREYQRELARRAHAAPGLLETFSDTMYTFESAWYGTRLVTPPDVRQFAEKQECLRRYVEQE